MVRKKQYKVNGIAMVKTPDSSHLYSRRKEDNMVIRKRIVLFTLGLFLAALPVAAQTGQITLLHVSDSHSHLDAWGPKDGNLDGTLGGIAKAAFLVAGERVADPAALFVH